MSLVRTSGLCCSYSRTTNSASLYAPFGAAPLAPWHAAQHLTLSSSSRSSVALTAIGSTSNQAIEKLDKEYCNEFVCESSPAVEMSVRSFAKDLERLRYTPNLFSRDTKYSDPVRQFQGNNTYLRHTWILDSIQKPKTVVNRMQMLDKATAQIDWRLTGLLGGAPVDISFTSVIEMNLLTGRILSTRETWDLKGLQAPIAFMVTANRTAWSAKQASMDAQEGLGRVADSISSSLDSMDDDGKIYRDPTDPTKFFQQGQNQQYNDMLTFAMIVIALYAVFKGFSTVIKL